MDRTYVGYRKDLPCVVGLRTRFAPSESMTPEEALKLADELIARAYETMAENNKLQEKAKRA